FSGGGLPSRSGIRKPDLSDFQTQSLPRDSQEKRGFVFVPFGVLQDSRQQEAIELAMRIDIQLAHVRREAPADDESVCARVRKGQQGFGCSLRHSRKLRKKCREQDCPGAPEQGLFEHALQLSHVARPGVASQVLLSLGGNLPYVAP